MNNYDTIIFDIGNVLVRFDWDGYVGSLWDKPIADRVNEAIAGGGRWTELDKGIRPQDEIVRSFVEADPELEKEILYTFEHSGESLHRVDHSIPWLRELKQEGKKLFYLSNYSAHIRYSNPGPLDFLSLMDGGVFSYEVKVIKPDHRIYQILCERYQLEPSHCIFLDDRTENIEAAKELGFGTILFHDYEQGREALKRMLHS